MYSSAQIQSNTSCNISGPNAEKFTRHQQNLLAPPTK